MLLCNIDFFIIFLIHVYLTNTFAMREHYYRFCPQEVFSLAITIQIFARSLD